MAVDVPATKWTPTQGNGEMGQQDEAGITTLAGVQITTLSGVSITTGDSTFTPIPATEWVEDDSV